MGPLGLENSPYLNHPDSTEVISVVISFSTNDLDTDRV